MYIKYAIKHQGVHMKSTGLYSGQMQIVNGTTCAVFRKYAQLKFSEVDIIRGNLYDGSNVKMTRHA